MVDGATSGTESRESGSSPPVCGSGVDGATSGTESRESGSRPPVCGSELVAGAASAASVGDETLGDEGPADAAWSLPIPPPPEDDDEDDDEPPIELLVELPVPDVSPDAPAELDAPVLADAA